MILQFSSFFSKLLGDAAKVYAKVDAASRAKEELQKNQTAFSEYRSSMESWKANVKIVLASERRKSSSLQKILEEKDQETDGLKVELKKHKSPQDIIVDFTKLAGYSKAVTEEAIKEIPKAFKVNKKFLRDNPCGLFGEFAPIFLHTSDDIEDEDEYDDDLRKRWKMLRTLRISGKLRTPGTLNMLRTWRMPRS